MSGKCLFSAPYSFLPDPLRKEFEVLLPTTFREIWNREDVPSDPGVVAWVPNPGQSFTIDDAVLARLPRLEVIATPSTGTNHIDREACRRRGVAVFGLTDDRPLLETITSSAEFTFLLLLNGLRRLDVAVGEARAGRWRAREDLMRGHELHGRHVGVVGLGRIGGRIARWSAAFDARVSYHDPYVANPDFARATLPEIFGRCDVVVVCPALTEETRGMITGSLFSLLPRGAVVVNTSRGEVLVEAEVADVLRSRPDITFAVDVLAGEVRNEHGESPFWGLVEGGQAIITPHVAGATFESQTKAAQGALRLLRRFQGAPP